MRHRTLVSGLTAFVLFAAVAGRAAQKPQPAVLDDGRLQKSWFGGDFEFRETDDIDYLWVKPGFTLDGRSLHFAEWPQPEFIGPDGASRDTKDKRLAQDMAREMADVFAVGFSNAFGSRLKVSQSEGDVLVEGRIVDCTTGSTAAKVFVGFGAGSGATTIDLRFKDAASGELLMAIHHRVVSGTTWSTTDSKFVDWVDETAELLAKKGAETVYKKGDRVNE
jgi:hypothetical protein